MTDVKRNHYVTMGQLRRFVNSEGQIWVHDRQEKNWFCTNPINAAVEKGMYSQQVEQWFSEKIEGPASAIFEKISSHDADLNKNEMLLVANFISMQMMRVSAVRDDVVEKYDAPGSSRVCRQITLAQMAIARI